MGITLSTNEVDPLSNYVSLLCFLLCALSDHILGPFFSSVLVLSDFWRLFIYDGNELCLCNELQLFPQLYHLVF